MNRETYVASVVRDNLAKLENEVDTGTLGGVIEILAMVCREKADHLRSNWQDEQAAKSWERDAKKLETIYSKIEN